MRNFILDMPDVMGDRYSPVFVSPKSIAGIAARKDTIQEVIQVTEKLASDEYTEFVNGMCRKAVAGFGDSWGYIDIVTLLYTLSKLGSPESYLEIGVRRGRSACAVAAATPGVSITAFDMWQENYANNDNPGPAFVEQELDKFSYTGDIEFIDGDSHATVPQYFAENPDKKYDLITVDGDHSIAGATDDLSNVVSHLAVGGVIVFDDIANPYCPGLADVWDKFIRLYPELEPHAYDEIGAGVAFAIKKYETGMAPAANKSWLRSLLG